MTLLAERDNNTVTVRIGELLIDVEAVTDERECIALILNSDDLQDALKQLASDRKPAPPDEH
jgi:predicted RNA-binding protein associated with RNAse of E/G family